MYTRTKICSLLFVLLFFAGTAIAQTIVVARDGSGHFKTVQEAIDAVKDSSTQVTTIFIKNGTYKEKLCLSETKMNVHFTGESVEGTILTYDDYASKKDSEGKNIGTTGSSSFFIFGAGFYAENITFENAAGPVGQAVAVRVTGDRAIFINCRFLGFQDTLYTQGSDSRQYYFKCYIEGTVDFIFGAATCLFDSCILYGKKGGYFTAASTPRHKKFGYVFRNCRLSGEAAPNSFFLGRPWQPFAKVVFMNCAMDTIIHSKGWDNWGKEDNEKTAFFAEYGNYGNGAATTNRVGWSKILSKEAAEEFMPVNILSGWEPRRQMRE
ncbi:MAG: pectinesterase family protein [Ferruginibacter sp.]